MIRGSCGRTATIGRDPRRQIALNTSNGCRQSRELIGRWHGRGRLSYAVTPRFAITSTEEQLREAGRLRSEGKGYVMQDGDVVHFLFNV